MNNQSVAKILAKASNCFYLVLDSHLQVETANHHFTDILNSPPNISGKSFYALISEPQKKEWQVIFEALSLNKDSVQTLTASFETAEQPVLINWNVCAIVNNKDVLTGFELLGVEETSTPGDENIQAGSMRLLPVVSKLRKILDSSLDIICTTDENGNFTKISAACKNILGYKPKEMVGRHFLEFVYKDDVESTIKANQDIKNGNGTTNFENRFYRKDGSVAPLIWSSKWEEADKRFYSVARDATEKKAREAALKVSEEKYRILFYNHPLPMWIYDTGTFNFLEVNEAAIELLGYPREEFLEMNVTDFLYQEETEKFENLYKVEGYASQKHRGLWIHKKKSGQQIILEITSNAISYDNRNAKVVLGIDRTDKIKAEEELLKSNERYLFLSQATFDAIWDWDLTTGKVQWNEGVRKMFDIPDQSDDNNAYWWYNNLHDEDRERVISKLNSHIKEQIPRWEDEYRFRNSKDSYIYVYDRAYTVFDEQQRAVRMIGAMQDLTERKAHEHMLQNLNNSLEKRARELVESNTELERFAYVASHDLQEPLRMVTSFLQLLEKRYRDKLDQKAHEYIDYAVDGAERMKRLILDLLEYSRVNSSKIEKEDVDLNEILQDLQHTYKNFLAETGGSITREKLPVVKGNKTQLLQLFQNLVSNAFKYRSGEPPAINIACTEDNKYYEFAITDNGIGIEPKFFNKIFIIFQRLHNREQYTGTGIGLAICKKIIDKHGGKIWVSSMPGHGSTFYFTIPKGK